MNCHTSKTYYGERGLPIFPWEYEVEEHVRWSTLLKHITLECTTSLTGYEGGIKRARPCLKYLYKFISKKQNLKDWCDACIPVGVVADGLRNWHRHPNRTVCFGMPVIGKPRPEEPSEGYYIWASDLSLSCGDPRNDGDKSSEMVFIERKYNFRYMSDVFTADTFSDDWPGSYDIVNSIYPRYLDYRINLKAAIKLCKKQRKNVDEARSGEVMDVMQGMGSATSLLGGYKWDGYIDRLTERIEYLKREKEKLYPASTPSILY